MNEKPNPIVWAFLVAALMLAIVLLLRTCGPEKPVEIDSRIRKASVVVRTPRAPRTPRPLSVRTPRPVGSVQIQETPPPAPTPLPLTVPDMIRARFGVYADKAIAVAKCESGNFAPDVVYGPRTGAAGERGVFQAHPGHWDGRWGGPVRSHVHGYTFDDMFTPQHNIDWAWHMSDGGTNWGPWTCA